MHAPNTHMHSHEAEAIHTSILSIFGNAALAIIKGVAGYFGNSFALIADAIESTTDVFSSILVLIGLKWSTKPPDENHPYGHGKIEALTTFGVVGFLIFSAGVIAFQAVQNLQEPQTQPESYTLWVLIVIIIFKEGMYQYVRGKGLKTNSTALVADAWHHRSDAITSLVAFIGIALSLYVGEGWEHADDWAALGAAGLIVFNAYNIFRPALGEILDEHLYDDLEIEIREKAIETEGVLGVGKCVIRKSGMKYHVDIEIEVDSQITVYHGHEIAHRLYDDFIFKLPQISHMLVHVEPADDKIPHVPLEMGA